MYLKNPKQLYRLQYYKVIDLVIAEIQRRFDQPTLTLLQEMETLLIESCNGKIVQVSSTIEEFYQADLNIDKLKLQLVILISTVNKDNHMGIKYVTKVSTVCDSFNEGKFPKLILKEVDKLLHLYLTIPLMSVTVERSFSGLSLT